MLIGEVSQQSGVSVRMLRHYDSLGLVAPSARTGSGYRRYSPDDLQRLLHVECLRSLGLSLAQIGEVLTDSAPTPAATVASLVEATRARIDAQQQLLARLTQIAESEPAGWGDVLGVVAMLRGLESESAATRQQAVLGYDPTAGTPAQALATALLTESDPNVAGALRWALVRADASADSQVMGELTVGAADPDPAVRRRAVAAIAAVAGTGSTEVLMAALDDDELDIREDAALAVGSSGVGAAMPVLIDMVVSGRRDVEAAEVLATLATGGVGTARMVSALTARLGPQQPQSARLRLVQALAEIPGPDSAAALDALGADLDRQVALAAVVVAQRVVTPRTADPSTRHQRGNVS